MWKQQPRRSYRNTTNNKDDSTDCETFSSSALSLSATDFSSISEFSRDFFGEYLSGSWKGYEEEEEKKQQWSFRASSLRAYGIQCIAFGHTLRRNPYILLFWLCTFVLLSSTGLVLVQSFADAYRGEQLLIAQDAADDYAIYFRDAIWKTLPPLFSLAQIVKHDLEYRGLASAIGNLGEDGARPSVEGTDGKFRNVTGICDKPELNARFHELSSTIINDSGLNEIVYNTRLAPHGVMCLVDPWLTSVGVESEYDAKFHHLGADFIHTSSRSKKIVEDTIVTLMNEVTFTGPFSHKDAKTKEVLTNKSFCSHLSVNMEEFSTVIDGESYPSWGFVMLWINFENLIEKSQIYERLEQRGLIFKLVRDDKVAKEENPDEFSYVETILAEDRLGQADLLHEGNCVDSKVVVGQDVWKMAVGFAQGFDAPWCSSARIAVILFSFVISCLCAAIMVEKKLHKELLFKMMPKRAIEKLERGETVVEKYSTVTIFFSDVVGFTAMAGTMSPIEVMRLLNDLYTEFDKLTEKHNIYKVETVGGSYVVAGGVPQRCSGPEGALKVAKFALDAIETVRTFRTSSGSRLFIRAGIASGPTVAGVVGKCMPRYCLFGDTVNLASLMESTSKKMRLQCSGQTYRLLQDSGDTSLNLIERVDSEGNKGVVAKGKGRVSSYWVTDRGDAVDIPEPNHNKFRNDLHLEEVVENSLESKLNSNIDDILSQPWDSLGQGYSRKEMVHILSRLLKFHLSALLEGNNSGGFESELLFDQIDSYIERVEALYNDVPFHNFEHAFQVTLSINKIISQHSLLRNHENEASIMSNDPYISFTLTWAALIHDLDHCGKTNKILEDINDQLTFSYNDSFLERHSLILAMELLNRPEMSDLEKFIMSSSTSKYQFQQILFDAVLSTDIMCKERGALIRDWWQRIYGDANNSNYNHEHAKEGCKSKNPIEVKNTEIHNLCPFPGLSGSACLNIRVIIQHMILVADIAHCMQGWRNYMKFNYRLYKELYRCFEAGLMKCPDDFWYNGENGFFEGYIIPLARRIDIIQGIHNSTNGVEHESLESKAKKNVSIWNEVGVEAHQIMQKGLKDGEDEAITISKLSQLVE